MPRPATNALALGSCEKRHEEILIIWVDEISGKQDTQLAEMTIVSSESQSPADVLSLHGRQVPATCFRSSAKTSDFFHLFKYHASSHTSSHIREVEAFGGGKRRTSIGKSSVL